MKDKITEPVSRYEPPTWLEEALRSTRIGSAATPGAAFLERCQQAAAVALDVRRMQAEKRRIGFVPVSFSAYLEGMAKALGISLPRVLACVGIADLNRVTRLTAALLAGLGKQLGFSCKETTVHFKISLGMAHSGPVPVLVAYRSMSTGGRSQLEECEAVLEELEAEWEPAVVEELRAVEEEVRKVYADGGDEHDD